MRGTPDFAIVAVACHFLLGGAVFLTDPRRGINRCFLALTVVLGGWITGIQLAYLATDAGLAEFAIRLSSACGALTPTGFALLRLSIIHHEDTWLKQVRRLRWWLVPGALFAVFCFSPFYLKGVEFIASETGGGAIAHPVFWPYVRLYVAYLAVSALSITVLMFSDQWRPRVSGVHRVELQFIWLGCLTIFLSVIGSLVVQSVFHSTQIVRFAAAFRVILFDIIIAYGITSRGILQIRAVIRLAMSYSLLAVYAGLIFGIFWFLLRWVFIRGGVDSPVWPSAIAGGLAAVLVNSLRSPFSRIATWILPPSDLDFQKTFNTVAHILQSVSTLDDLLDEFASVLSRAVGAFEVRVFLNHQHGYWEHRYLENGGPRRGNQPPVGVFLAEEDPVVSRLREGAVDLALEELARHASTAAERAQLGRLRALDSDLIVPVRYRSKLSALLILSGRVGGRIYGGDGRATLRLIAKQLGVAIANSRLYTEAFQSQAYNRLLVEHLPCGVITTDPDAVVNVLNPEARRLLQVDEQVAPSEVELPGSFGELVKVTLHNHAESPPEEVVLRPGARDQAHLRVNCMPMEGERGELLGAVLVLNDHTTLERLQRQVRQADRLASIGTLASGMAHEIKNPLTALKTFTQLLPKRYNDAEFRHDFSGLAGSEIDRIERIVNQLLAFARPAPLMIEQVNLHDIATIAIKLVGPQASRKNVTIRKALNAGHDYIAADKDRLQQVLLNLLLNALQATDTGGWIEITSELEPATGEHEGFIRLDVQDCGSGIPAETLPHIFDPFFTTKSEGTGLGLSVSYNIVTEHKGRLEVRSEVGKGTCFSLYMPIC